MIRVIVPERVLNDLHKVPSMLPAWSMDNLRGCLQNKDKGYDSPMVLSLLIILPAE